MCMVMNPGFAIYFLLCISCETSNTGKPAFAYYILLENEDFSPSENAECIFFFKV